jgi:hypothetical protein
MHLNIQYILMFLEKSIANSTNHDWIYVGIFVNIATLKNEKQMTSLESYMKTHMLVSV